MPPSRAAGRDFEGAKNGAEKVRGAVGDCMGQVAKLAEDFLRFGAEVGGNVSLDDPEGQSISLPLGARRLSDTIVESATRSRAGSIPKKVRATPSGRWV